MLAPKTIVPSLLILNTSLVSVPSPTVIVFFTIKKSSVVESLLTSNFAFGFVVTPIPTLEER